MSTRSLAQALKVGAMTYDWHMITGAVALVANLALESFTCDAFRELK